MAKFWFIVLLLVCSFCLQARINLVPNPSFEDTLGCPQFYPDLNGKVVDWYSFRGTPDYFNICSSGCGYNNQTGYQLPRTGVAYVGVATYAVAQSDVGEHLGIKPSLN
nr:hypothetical protein [Bacteroidota bacterium]